MNINQRIEKAMSGFTDDIWPMVCPDGNSPDEYIVYNPELEKPEDFGDDDWHAWMWHMQVHYYARGNSNVLKAKKEIISRLKAAGFSVSSAETMYESEKAGGYTHVCVSCSSTDEDISANAEENTESGTEEDTAGSTEE